MSTIGLLVVLAASSTAPAAPDAVRAPPAEAAQGPPAQGVCARPAGARTRAPDDARTRAMRAFMRKVGAPGAAMEDPCVATSRAGRCTCLRTALEPFYAALDETAARGARTGVVVFGNSLIAADGITDVIRARLASEFADGGPGLLLADRLADVGPRKRTAAAAKGWRVENCAYGDRPSAPLGATGVQHVSEGPAYSRFNLDGARSATIFWTGRDLDVRMDDGPWQPLDAGAPGSEGADSDVARVSRLDLAPTQRSLWLRARREGAVVQGVSLERGGGVVLDTLGVPSADATLWLKVDEENFTTQLRARAPSLVMVMLGGNEAKRIEWGRSTRASIEQDLRGLIARVRGATGAACLVVGPIDGVVGPDAADPFRERRTLRTVIEIEREVALQEGCAFLDLYAAMGGRGSLKRLADLGLVWDDLVHPRGRALDMLGQLVVDALLDGYARSQPAAVAEKSAQMTFGGT